MNTTPELLTVVPGGDPPAHEVAWLVEFLEGRDWMFASAILLENNLPDTDQARRRLRNLAHHSGGRIAGGQRGYKLVAEMTAVEFGHFERWMASQENQMKIRRVEAQRVFYARTRV